MNLTWNSPGPQLTLRRLIRQVAGIISEMNYARRRTISLVTAYDRCPFEPDVPPENYAEFLLRTSGVLQHEPPASERLAGRPIR